MSEFSYCATDLITGEVLADTIPLTVTSFSRQINGAGSLTGTLSLQTAAQVNQPYVAALEVTRCHLWVLQDGFPVWEGIVWDWPHTSIAPPAVLPITAQTIESLFSRRLITDTLGYSHVDLFTAFCDLVTYGTSKDSPYISPLSPAANRLPALATDAMAVAGLTLPSGLAGATWSANYPYTDRKKVADAWADMIASGNFEYTFDPGLAADGSLGVFLRLGYTQIGRPLESSNLQFFFPGNVVDYAWPRTGSQSANGIWASAPPNGSAAAWQSQYPHGFDTSALAAGYPLLEDTVTWNGSTVTAQAQVDQFADSQMALKSGAMTLPSLIVGGDGIPAPQEIILGDTASFTAVSALHPPSGSVPSLQAQIRIAGWTYTPPGQNQQQKLVVTGGGVAT